MIIVPASQPAFPNALGIANAPVPTIRLNKNTRPTYNTDVNKVSMAYKYEIHITAHVTVSIM